MQKKVLLDSTDKVVQFVKLSQTTDCDVDVVAGNRLCVDAKSIMGVLSCLNKEPVTLDIHGQKDEIDAYLDRVSMYCVS